MNCFLVVAVPFGDNEYGHLMGFQRSKYVKVWKQVMILFHYHYIKYSKILLRVLYGGVFKGITLHLS